MERFNRRMLIYRLLEIFFGVVALGFSVGICAAGDARDPPTLSLSASFLAAGVVLFGFFGLFGVGMRNDGEEGKMAALIFVIDASAIVAAMSTGTCLAIQAANSGDSFRFLSEATTCLTGAVFGFLSTIPIVPLLVRTLKVYTVSVNYWVKDTEFDTKYDFGKIEGRLQYLESVCGAPPAGPASIHPDEATELKSLQPSRPVSVVETTAHWTVVSGSATLPQTDIITAANPPGPLSDVPSQSAPSYTSRVR